MIERLELLEKRYNEINEELLKPEILSDFSKQKKLSKEKGSIEEAVIKYGEYKSNLKLSTSMQSLLFSSFIPSNLLINAFTLKVISSGLNGFKT